MLAENLESIGNQKHGTQITTMRICIEGLENSDQVTHLVKSADFFGRIVDVIQTGSIMAQIDALSLLYSLMVSSRDNIYLFVKRFRFGIDIMISVMMERVTGYQGGDKTGLAIITNTVKVLELLSETAAEVVLAKVSETLSKLYSMMSPIPGDIHIHLACLIANIITRDDFDGHIAIILNHGVILSATFEALIQACRRFLKFTGHIESSILLPVQKFATALCSIVACAVHCPLEEITSRHDAICTILEVVTKTSLRDEVTSEVNAQLTVLLGLIEIDRDSIPNDILRQFDIFSRIESDCQEIWSNPGDEDTISSCLCDISDVLSTEEDSAIIASSVPDIVKILIKCLGNIDEQIMVASLNAIYSLFLSCPDFVYSQFMNREGFDALAECLHDYNVAIRVTTLEILSVANAQRADMRTILLQSGILRYIMELVGQFGRDDDISSQIVEAAAGVLSLALTDNPANQLYLSNQNGVAILIGTIQVCSDCGDLTTTVEALLLTLNNLVYRDRQSQEEFRKHGGFELAFSLWQKGTTIIIHSVLNLLINAVDTCEPNQEVLCQSSEIVVRMGGLLSDPDLDIAALGCLLISHATWNHPTNQSYFSNETIARRLLDRICTSKDAAQSTPRLGMFALMGLANLSYQNRVLQELVNKLNGIQIMHGALVDAISTPMIPDEDEVGFTAITTALSNVVSGHRGNGEDLAKIGGIELLLTCITDRDDDEVSKRAFSTIVQTGAPGTLHIIQVLQQARGGPSNLQIEPLQSYLTALNGIVYLSPEMDLTLVADIVTVIISYLSCESYCDLTG
uniref:Uncharacterized protein n=1 Tax=Spongospora subterranea TaxID=70186 RepID=A0A0H5RT11_9EUKA|eukprot:CRZ11869.1 hypothetical protein [Spongospora subterranea]